METLEESFQSQPLGSGELYFSFLRAEYLYKSCGILYETFAFYPIFTYLSNYISWTKLCVFLTMFLLAGITRGFWIILYIFT